MLICWRVSTINFGNFQFSTNLQHLRTTLVRHCAQWLQRRGYHVRGFVTDEVRKSGRRGGFDVVAMGNLGMASGGGLE